MNPLIGGLSTSGHPDTIKITCQCLILDYVPHVTERDYETKLSREEREVVEKLIEKAGLVEVAKKLKIAPQTLRTIAGGLKGQRGTLALVRQGLGR